MKTSPQKKENPRIHNTSYTARTNRVELSRTHVSRALQTPAVYLHTPFQPPTIKLQIAVLEDARVVSTLPKSECNENFDFSSKIFFKELISPHISVTGLAKTCLWSQGTYIGRECPLRRQSNILFRYPLNTKANFTTHQIPHQIS